MRVETQGWSMPVSTVIMGMPASWALLKESSQPRESAAPTMMASTPWVMAVSTAAFWASASWTSVVRLTNSTPISSALASAARARVSQNSLVEEKPEKAMVTASSAGSSAASVGSSTAGASVGAASSAGPQLASTIEAMSRPIMSKYQALCLDFILFLRFLFVLASRSPAANRLRGSRHGYIGASSFTPWIHSKN